MKLNTITDMDIQALVDDELETERINQVLQHLKENPDAAQRHETLIKQKILLKKWWRHCQN